MFKLIKYELRGTLLTIVGIYLTVIATNLFLLTRKIAWGTNLTNALSICLSIAALTMILISALNLMVKPLQNDTGYLLFSLPQPGINILISKLITAVIQIALVVLVVFLGLSLTVSTPEESAGLQYIKLSGLIYGALIYVCVTVAFLTFVYFCMVMSKVILRNNSLMRIISFIIFGLLAIVIIWIDLTLPDIFPQSITLWESSFLKIVPEYVSNDSVFSFNISTLIFEFLTFVALFKGTVYMLDNKLDL